MVGKYLIGIDIGTQSAKVVVYDARGQRGLRGQADTAPHGATLEPGSWSIPTTTSGSRSRRQPARRWPGYRRPGGHRRRRPLHHPLLQGLPEDGSFAGGAGHELDGHPRLPAVRAGRPPRSSYVTTSSGYLTHRFTGEFKDTAANNILLQWPIDTDTWQWSDPELRAWNIPGRCSSSCRCRGTSPGM